MYLISVTRLRLRSFWFLPQFMLHNERAVKQVTNTEGFVKGFELIDKGLVFWTVTVWTTAGAMKYFRNNGAHQQAMRKLPGWCNEASYIHWEQELDTIPDMQTIHSKLVKNGVITKVKKPSARHLDKSYPAPKWEHSKRALKPFVQAS